MQQKAYTLALFNWQITKKESYRGRASPVQAPTSGQSAAATCSPLMGASNHSKTCNLALVALPAARPLPEGTMADHGLPRPLARVTHPPSLPVAAAADLRGRHAVPGFVPLDRQLRARIRQAGELPHLALLPPPSAHWAVCGKLCCATVCGRGLPHMTHTAGVHTPPQHLCVAAQCDGLRGRVVLVPLRHQAHVSGDGLAAAEGAAPAGAGGTDDATTFSRKVVHLQGIFISE